MLWKKYREPSPPDIGYPIRYWSEFATPRHLIDQLRPDKIVFADLEMFYDVALNVAARRAGIPTFGLEHGLRYPEEVQAAYGFRDTAVIQQGNWRSVRGIAQRLDTLRFYFSVYPLCTLAEQLTLTKFLYRRSTQDMTVALHQLPFDLRFPDWFINYSVANAGYLMERDGVPLSRFKLIGNPTLDEFFDPTVDASHVPGEDFYLLIDSPLVETASIAMPAADKRVFLEKLNTFCKSRGARLYVKLHPYSYIYSYSTDYLPKDPNIIYGRDVRTSPLVRRAKGVFGLVSTLVAAAVCLNRCVVFQLTNQPFPDELVRRGVAAGLDFATFQPDDIDFARAQPDPAALAAFTEHYLYSADGKSTERLRQLLMS